MSDRRYFVLTRSNILGAHKALFGWRRFLRADYWRLVLGLPAGAAATPWSASRIALADYFKQEQAFRTNRRQALSREFQAPLYAMLADELPVQKKKEREAFFNPALGAPYGPVYRAPSLRKDQFLRWLRRTHPQLRFSARWDKDQMNAYLRRRTAYWHEWRKLQRAAEESVSAWFEQIALARTTQIAADWKLAPEHQKLLREGVKP